ncbi:extracellular solute-binding protein [Jeotgalibaca caeni]|uniref:ABC transporter substrate-binding protein n=1 Tax=Jeotgalibaca caeni TaxID=3028623 RepID=UPI00237E804F|nr:extracellular solute-binding protein [Jeotgalibaca caeni]MDE1548821.1 extracellular solute-binding protein [Jeotgalibaca caeni]
MFNKKISKFIFSSAAVLALAACGNGASTESGEDSVASDAASSAEGNNQDQIVLRMAWWGSQARHDATVEVIEMYEEENPNIDIQYEFFDMDGYITKLNTLVASDSIWDIFQLGGNYPAYIDNIQPLDSFIEDGTIDTSNTTEMFLDTTRDQNGNMVGLSLGVNSYGIAYDPAMFEQAGVEEPAENWTWAEYKDAALKVSEEFGVFGSSIMDDFLAGGTIGVGPDYNFFDKDDQTKLGFDDPGRLVDYIAMRKELVDKGAYPDPGAAAEVTDIEGDFVVTGEAAMTWVATNQFPTLASAAGKELKLTTLPRKDKDDPYGLTLNSSQMLSIPTSSEHQEEAAKFINFFVNDEEANQILNGERGVPIMSNIREMLEENASPELLEVFSYVDYVGEQHNEELNNIENPHTAEIRDQYELLLDQVIYDEITPEEAAQQIYDFAVETIK